MTNREESIHKAIFQALALSIHLDPDSGEASRRILRSWGEQPPPQASRETALVYYDFSPDPGAAMYTEQTVRNRRRETYRYIPCRLNLVFYGPLGINWAFRVRENLFLDGAKAPRAILRRAGIFPIPSRRPLSTFYDEAGGLFRRRADLSIAAYLLDNDDGESGGAAGDVPTIAAPPEVVIHRKEG